MRVVAAALLLLALAGCGRSIAPSEPSEYNAIRALLHSERYQQAAGRTEAALRHTQPGSVWYWRLRILRAEILLARREAVEANAALDFQPPQTPEELGRYRLCQGYAASLLHEYSEAHARLAQAAKLAAAAGDETLLAEINVREGWLAVNENQPAEARRRFEQVLEVAVRRNDPWLRMTATGNLGFLLLKEFHYDAAIPQFEQTLPLAKNLGAVESQARCMENLGWCYYRLGDLDKALTLFQQADVRFQQTGNRLENQRCLGNIGSIFMSREDYGPAATHYEHALQLSRALRDRPDAATWLTNLAEIEIERSNLDAATRYNDEALAIERVYKDQQETTHCLINAGRIALARRAYPRAETFFRNVLRSREDDPPLLLDAHANLAAALAGSGRSDAADAEFRATIAALETQRSELMKSEYKLTWIASLIRFYQQYVDFLMNRGDSRAALKVADSSRARVMADKLGLAHQHQRAAGAVYENVARESDSTLLSYWVTPGKSRLWVINSEGLSTYSLPSESELRSLVDAHQKLIENLEDPLTSGDAAGQKLYAALIAPAEAAIRKTGRVILLPDGPLYSLNFETLPVPGPSPHYWIEDAVVSISPSLELLRPAKPEASQRSLLLIGNPNSPDPELPALPYAPQEMSAIEAALHTSPQVVRATANAKPEAYLRGDPQRFSIIHFVAHAVVNREEPLQSAVVLSGSRRDYKLLARDIISIPIRADLVTISGCRSAAARTYAGEGLVGFSWAFLQAGARHVIASLWDVNDRSTAALMGDLYAVLARGSTPADALRSAKLALLHSGTVWRKPWYWAPFQIYSTTADTADQRTL
ncbi:MAG TPA: CHAT domain-containing protein [Bryobacteraceae bacterium]|nr:CHAT domain-containing protein [Bryobacteraceae bacterium]